MDTPASARSFLLRLIAWSLGLFGILRLPWIATGVLLPATRLQALAGTRLIGAASLPIEATLACSGADALALCSAAILAYPARWRTRAVGMAGGLIVLLTLNTIRIGTLGRAAASPRWFSLLHVYIWPTVLTLAIAVYVFAWMGIAHRPSAPDRRDDARSAPQSRRFVMLTLVFLAVFAAASPLYLESATVLAIADFVARAAAATLRAAGVTAQASGNVLWTARGGFLVTQECISTPVMPIYLAAVCTVVTGRTRLVLALLAAVPLFVLLGIIRLLVVALPLAASPLFMVHAFYQALLALVIISVAAVWRHGWPRAVAHAGAAVVFGVAFALLTAPLYARMLGAPAGITIPDPQGALAFLPPFQAGLYLALFVAAFVAAGWWRFACGFALLGLSQAAGVLALRAPFGLTLSVPEVRAWAVAAPVLIVAAVLQVSGRLAEIGAVAAIATGLTVLMAMPVLLAPSERLFGAEVIGRHHDPFTVMEQFARPSAHGVYWQPVTDVPGALVARVMGPVAGYNGVVLFSFPLSALAAYLLGRHLRLSHPAAAVAALAYAFSPFHVAQAAYHPQIAQTQWIPLYLLALWKCLDHPSWRTHAFLVAAAAAVTLSNFYGGLIAAVITPFAAGAYWCFSDHTEAGSFRRLAAAIGMLAAIALCGLAYAWSADPALLIHPDAFAFPRADLFRYSAKWWSYLVPPIVHPLLGATGRRIWTAAGAGPAILEQQVSLGWSVIALGLVGALHWRRRDPRSGSLGHVPLLALVGAVALVCSLSPERRIGGVTFVRPSAVLYALLPMFRSYARFGVVVQLSAALLAGIGLDQLRRDGTRRARLAGLVLIALIAAEYAVSPAVLWRDVLPTRAHRWVMRQPAPMRVLDCAPLTEESASIPWLTADRITMLGGPVDDCTAPNLPGTLAAAGYTHLLVRRGIAVSPRFPDRPAPDGLRLAARFPDGRVFAVAAPRPPVYTAAWAGFFAREHDEERSWRWMGTDAAWTIVNTLSRPLTVNLAIELTAAGCARHLQVRLDGQALTVLDVEPSRAVYEVGPAALSPGAHELIFHSAAPPAIPSRLGASGDGRALSVAVGDWTWTTRDGPS